MMNLLDTTQCTSDGLQKHFFSAPPAPLLYLVICHPAVRTCSPYIPDHLYWRRDANLPVTVILLPLSRFGMSKWCRRSRPARRRHSCKHGQPADSSVRLRRCVPTRPHARIFVVGFFLCIFLDKDKIRAGERSHCVSAFGLFGLVEDRALPSVLISRRHNSYVSPSKTVWRCTSAGGVECIKVTHSVTHTPPPPPPLFALPKQFWHRIIVIVICIIRESRDNVSSRFLATGKLFGGIKIEGKKKLFLLKLKNDWWHLKARVKNCMEVHLRTADLSSTLLLYSSMGAWSSRYLWVFDLPPFTGIVWLLWKLSCLLDVHYEKKKNE